MTSQAENRKPLQRVSIVIMPEYLFETKGFRINSQPSDRVRVEGGALSFVSLSMHGN